MRRIANYLRECSDGERCRKSRAAIRVSWIWVVVLLFASYLGWTFYPEQQISWASIDEMHAGWQRDGSMWISLRFTKNYECNDVVVSKHLVPVVGKDVIVTNPIPLEGTLAQQMTRAKIGTHDLLDEHVQVKPNVERPERGRFYQMEVVATCNDASVNDLPIEARSTPIVRKAIMAARRPSTSLVNTVPRFS